MSERAGCAKQGSSLFSRHEVSKAADRPFSQRNGLPNTANELGGR
jgi:hypothetical protein